MIKKLSILIPAYNEGRTIHLILDRVRNVELINGIEKELIIERKEMLQEKTFDYFNSEYMVNTLLIPKEYVNGFVYYIDDNVPFATAMRNKNKTQATFILHQLAVDYLNLKEIPLKVEDRKPIDNQVIKE